MYFNGDFRQLPPIMDTALYEPNPKTIEANRGIEMFKSFDRYFELKISHRQTHSSRFSQLLDRLSEGTITDLDYEIMSRRDDRVINELNKERFKDATYLCPINDDVNKRNI